MSATGEGQHDRSTARQPSWIFEIPFTPSTLSEAAEEVERLILRRTPSYLVTANLNYAMLVARHPYLHEVNRNAALIVADGMPLVWTSRLTNRPLPERVTGADLIYRISELAAYKGYSLFFLGAPPGVAEQAACRLAGLYPGLRVVGTDSAEVALLMPDEHSRLVARIRDARADVLFVALGTPKGQHWIFQNFEDLGFP
jgi:N-acetylglucosaminyldiphosphoundecaprenol N-acetyl-beta-D-mannosaminyltransferase